MVNVLIHRLDFEVSVFSLCLWILSGHADSGVKLDRDSKLAVGVNSCLSLCKLCDRLVNCPERWMDGC